MLRNQVSDTDIRLDVRSHLARYRIDTQVVRIWVCAGRIRMSGEIYHLGRDRELSAAVLEALERDLAATKGVRGVSFDFGNWLHAERGGWKLVGGTVRPLGAPEVEEEPALVLLQNDDA